MSGNGVKTGMVIIQLVVTQILKGHLQVLPVYLKVVVGIVQLIIVL